jgi:hypothetical protein
MGVRGCRVYDGRPVLGLATRIEFHAVEHSASQAAERTIAVLSPDCPEAPYTLAEWAAAFAEDATGSRHRAVFRSGGVGTSDGGDFSGTSRPLAWAMAAVNLVATHCVKARPLRWSNLSGAAYAQSLVVFKTRLPAHELSNWKTSSMLLRGWKRQRGSHPPDLMYRLGASRQPSTRVASSSVKRRLCGDPSRCSKGPASAARCRFYEGKKVGC